VVLWFERAQVTEMLRLAASGQMDLSVFEPEVFELAEISQALAAAHKRPNPLRHVSIFCK
jgi:hypothetical protein